MLQNVMICVYTVCLGLWKGILGLYGLNLDFGNAFVLNGNIACEICIRLCRKDP